MTKNISSSLNNENFYFSHLTKPYFSILLKTSFELFWEMLGHPGGEFV